jgi:hypothetical protein
VLEEAGVAPGVLSHDQPAAAGVCGRLLAAEAVGGVRPTEPGRAPRHGAALRLADPATTPAGLLSLTRFEAAMVTIDNTLARVFIIRLLIRFN